MPVLTCCSRHCDVIVEATINGNDEDIRCTDGHEENCENHGENHSARIWF